MTLKTIFLNPPSFKNFDGGASSRWPATREIESYWYPVWLTYPAGLLEGSRVLDAPPHHVSAEETIEICKDYEFLVLFTSTVGWEGDQRLAETDQSGESIDPHRLCGTAGDHRSRPRAERVFGARLHLPARVRLFRRGVRQRQTAQRDSRHQLQEGRQGRSQPRPPADRRP